MKDGSVLDQFPLKFRRIDQVSVMRQSQSPFDIRQHKGLGVFRHGSPRSRITHVSDGDISLHFCQRVLMKHFIYQSQIFVKTDIPGLPVCSGDSYPAGFLPPVLQGGQSVVN